MERIDWSDANNRVYRFLFFTFAAVIALVMLLSSDQYGICWDEPLQKEYGELALKYYSSGGKDTSFINEKKLTHLYGGFVEITAAVFTNYFKGDPYNIRHLYISVFGILSIIICGLLARLFGGWRSGVTALLFLFLSPVFFGHSMFNSKDIPFAFGYISSVYFLLRYIKDFPKISLVNCLGLVVSISIAINIRVGGILLIAYLALFFFVRFVYDLKKNNTGIVSALKLYRRNILVTVVLAVASYFGGLLFWPFALMNPLHHPFEALNAMSSYELVFYNLFNGEMIYSSSVPWYYIPLWIIVTSPLFIFAAIIVIPFSFWAYIRKKQLFSSLLFALLCFTFVFPVAYVIYKNSNLYDGWRHLMFAYPPLAAACAIAWDKLITFFPKRRIRLIIITFLSLLIAEPLLWMIRNHKLEQFYFSPLTGGTEGAFKKFEIDYYGTSIRYAVEWLAENSDTLRRGPDGKIRVRQWYGEAPSTQIFINKYSNLQFVTADNLSADWDYDIVLPTRSKYEPELLKNWPPKGIVHLVEADEGPVAAIVRNGFTEENLTAELVQTTNNFNELINLSVQYYSKGDFLNCVAACFKALQISPGNKIAYNNLASAFNNLYMREEAVFYANEAIKADTSFKLAKGNLEVALNLQIPDDPATRQLIANNFINVGLLYYNFRDYRKCIELNKTSLRFNPGNAVAYNNIGAAYNVIGLHDEAIAALEMAIKIDPANQLAKNNLEDARRKRNSSK